MTQWKENYTGRSFSTTEAGVRELIENDEGIVENNRRSTENIAEALARLVTVLENKGLLNESDTVYILGLYMYEAEE